MVYVNHLPNTCVVLFLFHSLNYVRIYSVCPVSGELGIPVDSTNRTLAVFIDCDIHPVDAMVSNFAVARVRVKFGFVLCSKQYP